MRSRQSFTTLASGVVIGALVFGSVPSLAQMPVVDWTSIPYISSISSVIKQVYSGVTNLGNQIGEATYGTTNQLLQEGFTQNGNYSKAQISAQEQIADASNTAMARFGRDMRNADLRDQYSASPLACAAVDNGATVIGGAKQAWKVSAAIEGVTDLRGEADKSQPAYYGSAQAVQALDELHTKRYCSQIEADAGRCQVGAQPNADQRASSLFGTGTYDGQDGVTAANDYVTNLLQPVVPGALRGDRLTSVAGREAAAQRRKYNARMSLSRAVLNQSIASQTQAVPLSTEQKQEMTDEGMTPVDNGSWMQALGLDINRRYASLNYQAQLQAMPPASVQREIATEIAATNYLLMQIYKLQMMHASVSATQLAADTERNYSVVRMPTPNISGTN